MTISAKLCLTAFALSAVALGSAGAAQADPPLLNGTYAGTDGDPYNVWTINSSCEGTCTAQIASNQGWRSTAQLVNGHWDFTVTKPDGVICPDGSYAPAYIQLALDPATLAGVVTTDSNYSCPGGTISQAPFQLHQVS